MADKYLYQGTLSSGGKQTTPSANYVITFIDSRGNPLEVSYVLFETFSESCTISINEETTIHQIDENSFITMSDLPIYKITVHETAVDYRWTALY